MGDCCFYKRLLPKTLNKKQQAPKLPKHPPKRAGFDNFLDPHFVAICRTVCKFAPQRGTKMASKKIPLCDSMALWGPSRGPPWETPEGLGPSRGPCMRCYTHHVRLLRPVGPGLHDNACNPHPCSSATPLWTRPFTGPSGFHTDSILQHRTNCFLTLWGKPGARGGARGQHFVLRRGKYLAPMAPSMLTPRKLMRRDVGCFHGPNIEGAVCTRPAETVSRVHPSGTICRILLLFPSLSTTGVPRAHPSETICRRVLLFPSLSTTGVPRAHPSGTGCARAVMQPVRQGSLRALKGHGASRSHGSREGPKVLDCCTWVPFCKPFW